MSALVSSLEKGAPYERRPRDTTPYEGQRRRARWLELFCVLVHEVPLPVARAMVGRDVALTPDQLVNIRKRKRKRDLDGCAKSRIDSTFIAMAARFQADLAEEVALAAQSGRRLDPRRLAAAKASHAELAALIAEHEAGEDARRRIARAEAAGSWIMESNQ